MPILFKKIKFILSSSFFLSFLKNGINWVQSHPIAGSEVSGPEHGKENMFVDKWCVLIKDKKTNPKHLKFLISFWRKVGSKTVLMGFGFDSDAIHSPNEHFGVKNFYKGIETIILFYKNFCK